MIDGFWLVTYTYLQRYNYKDPNLFLLQNISGEVSVLLLGHCGFNSDSLSVSDYLTFSWLLNAAASGRSRSVWNVCAYCATGDLNSHAVIISVAGDVMEVSEASHFLSGNINWISGERVMESERAGEGEVDRAAFLSAPQWDLKCWCCLER